MYLSGAGFRINQFGFRIPWCLASFSRYGLPDPLVSGPQRPLSTYLNGMKSFRISIQGRPRFQLCSPPCVFRHSPLYFPLASDQKRSSFGIGADRQGRKQGVEGGSRALLSKFEEEPTICRKAASAVAAVTFNAVEQGRNIIRHIAQVTYRACGVPGEQTVPRAELGEPFRPELPIKRSTT